MKSNKVLHENENRIENQEKDSQAEVLYWRTIRECVLCLTKGDNFATYTKRLREAEDAFLENIKLNGSTEDKEKATKITEGLSNISKMKNRGYRDYMIGRPYLEYVKMLKDIEENLDVLKKNQGCNFETEKKRQSFLIKYFQRIEVNFYELDCLLRGHQSLRQHILLYKNYSDRATTSQSVITGNAIDNLEKRFNGYVRLNEEYDQIFDADKIMAEFKKRMQKDIFEEISFKEKIKVMVYSLREKIELLLPDI